VSVTNEGDAGAAMRRGRFDVLVLGWNYESFDAFCFAKSLCSQFPHLSRSSIIVMADHMISLQGRRQLSDFGVRWILQKPVVATSLPKLIRHVIAQTYDFNGMRRLSHQVPLGESVSAMLPAVYA
jgi:DNA-binding NarL/FixJ family response regulator